MARNCPDFSRYRKGLTTGSDPPAWDVDEHLHGDEQESISQQTGSIFTASVSSREQFPLTPSHAALVSTAAMH